MEVVECQVSGSGGISSVRFNPFNSEVVAISTWDSNVECYNTRHGGKNHQIKMNTPQLCMDWIDNDKIISGGADGAVNINGVAIGSHKDAVSCVSSIDRNIFASGSWDGTIKLWDPRQNSIISEYPTPVKINCMTKAPPQSLICGGSDRAIFMLDTRKLEEPVSRESSISYQTRCVAANENNFAIGSVEGRVAIEARDGSHQPFAFKAHYKNIERSTMIYPVNSLCFSPATGDLATAGSDGNVYMWNLKQKKRLAVYGPFETSVCSTSFDSRGEYLAVGVSYCFEQGELSQHPLDQLLVIRV